jgi:MOSC domain-containing protein YiiM
VVPSELSSAEASEENALSAADKVKQEEEAELSHILARIAEVELQESENKKQAAAAADAAAAAEMEGKRHSKTAPIKTKVAVNVA